MSFITTPHINAEADALWQDRALCLEIHLRSKFIAENSPERMPSWSITSEVFRDIQENFYNGTKARHGKWWVCLPLESILIIHLHSLV